MMARRPLVAGNWKMHGLQSSIGELEKIIAGAPALAEVELMVCPPATLIASFAAAARGSRVLIGGQDCHALAVGAYTGDISAEMLKDAGAAAVIIGHSERRQNHGETDADVRAKALAARRAGLLAIVCVGETRAEREAGQALAVVGRQLDGSLPDGAGRFRHRLRAGLGHRHGADADTRRRRRNAPFHPRTARLALWRSGAEGPHSLWRLGQSGECARELLAIENVDGALVGGASLKAGEFLAIAGFYRQLRTA